MNLGKRIKVFRAMTDLSQMTLAKKLGVTQTTVYNWEKGHKTLSVRLAHKLIKVAREFNISMTLDDLYNEEQ